MSAETQKKYAILLIINIFATPGSSGVGST